MASTASKKAVEEEVELILLQKLLSETGKSFLTLFYSIWKKVDKCNVIVKRGKWASFQTLKVRVEIQSYGTIYQKLEFSIRLTPNAQNAHLTVIFQTIASILLKLKER